MRRVGRGQRVDLLVPPEIAKLIRIHAAIGRGEAGVAGGGADGAKAPNAAPPLSRADVATADVGDHDAAAGPGAAAAARLSPLGTASSLRDTCAWAVVNGLASESLQLAR
eukprot:scaffold20170_cov78-Isochrysis_galbana.AAC.1